MRSLYSEEAIVWNSLFSCFQLQGSCKQVRVGGAGWQENDSVSGIETRGLMARPTAAVRERGRGSGPGKENTRKGIPIPVCLVDP